MRAVVLAAFGPPENLHLEEVADPTAGAGEVLVDVELAGITFVETQVRAGHAPHPGALPSLPTVLGNGVAGTVSRVGEGVGAEWVGRRVVTPTGGSGGYAEQVAVSAANLIEVPREMHLADALALLADGRTAIGLVDLVPMCAGERVLIEAAAGGVGSLLVQLAASAGATVVAAARGPRKADVATSLGAALSVDYSQPGWDDQVRASLGAVDVVFDGVGGEIGQGSFGLLADGGRFVSYGMASGTFAPIASAVVTRRRIEVLRPPPREPAELTGLSRRALDEAAAGRLHPLVGQTFPLDQAGRAHAAIGSRETIGKTLLVVRAGPS